MDDSIEPCEHEPKVARGLCRRCYNREYYRSHADYRERLKAQKRARHAADPESTRLKNAAYYAANRDREALRRKAWTEANSERQRAYDKAWRLRNLDRAAAAAARRRARLASADGTFTADEWAAMKASHEGRCFYCGSVPEMLVIEHMTPLVRGGANSKENIVPSCGSCNNRKGTKTADEFLSAIQKEPTQ